MILLAYLEAWNIFSVLLSLLMHAECVEQSCQIDPTGDYWSVPEKISQN